MVNDNVVLKARATAAVYRDPQPGRCGFARHDLFDAFGCSRS
jgi:hypothetical protein